MKRMKIAGRRKGILSFLVLMAILATAPGFWLPMLVTLAQKTAVLSAVIAMPEGSLAALEERFKSEIHVVTREGEPQDPGSSQSEITRPLSPSSQGEKPPQSSPSFPYSRPDSDQPDELPLIPEARRRPLSIENMSGYGNSNYFEFGSALIRNDTYYNFERIKKVLGKGLEMKLEQSAEPQVLIVHTHATEAYTPYDMDYYDTEYTWRSTDHTKNMIAVGDVLAQALEFHGIGVIHDTTLHDYPSYNGGYERSAATVSQYLEKYPSIKVVFDVHRDAIERDNEVIVKPTVEIDGKKAAQVMIISCADDPSGSVGIPNWERNFRFAAAISSAINERYPELMRPVFFCHRKYNQNLSDGALLLEFGTHASTLEEAKYSASLIGDVIGEFLHSTVPE